MLCANLVCNMRLNYGCSTRKWTKKQSTETHHLSSQQLGAQAFLVVLKASIKGCHSAMLHQPQLVHCVFYQILIVTDQQHTTLEHVEPMNKRIHCLDIKVVGRLIKEQKVGLVPCNLYAGGGEEMLVMMRYFGTQALALGILVGQKAHYLGKCHPALLSTTECVHCLQCHVTTHTKGTQMRPAVTDATDVGRWHATCLAHPTKSMTIVNPNRHTYRSACSFAWGKHLHM